MKQSYGERLNPQRDMQRYEMLTQIQSPVKKNINLSNLPKRSKSCSNFSTPSEEVQTSSSDMTSNGEKEVLSRSKSLADKTFSALLKNEILDQQIESLDQLDANNQIINMASPRKTATVTRRRLFEHAAASPVKDPTSRATPGTHVSRAFDSAPLSRSSRALLASPQKRERTITRTPYKILDAPDLADDFYLNLLDWSSRDSLAVGLGTAVYLWHASSSQVTCLTDLGQAEDAVTSVAWHERGEYLAVGTKRGIVYLWDAIKMKLIRPIYMHSERIGVISWNQMSIATGSRDRSICLRDLRTNSNSQKIQFHAQEVCGLKWSPNQAQLASGGNDNNLCVWTPEMLSRPLHNFTEHSAAVKALGWSFTQEGLLASGGGTVDRSLRFWNTLTGSLVHTVDTGSQVCSLLWSRHANELVSVHGYSQNHVAVWRYPQMTQIGTMVGHSSRVLYLTGSPCGKNIVTGAGDETLRFWEAFEKPETRSHAVCALEPRLTSF